MGKTTHFDRKDSPVHSDPVADAHASAIAADEAAEQGASQGGQSAEQPQAGAFENLVIDQGIVEAPSEQPEPEIASVQDTTVQQPPEKEQPVAARIEPRKHDSRSVQRPSGARARESSPQGVVGQAVQQTTNAFAALIAKEKIKGTGNAISLIDYLETYVRDMAPGRITRPDVVVTRQEGLLDEIMFILERSPANEFKRLWSILIAFVGEYKDTVFSPKYYCRGAKEWRRSPQQFQNLTLIMNLLQASGADIATVNEQVNVSSVVAEGYSEDARGRLIGYYMN